MVSLLLQLAIVPAKDLLGCLATTKVNVNARLTSMDFSVKNAEKDFTIIQDVKVTLILNS